MAKKKKTESFSESYLLIKDEQGFKVLHPEFGPCLLTDWNGNTIDSIDFSNAIVGDHPERGGVEIWGEGDSLDNAVEDLMMDGYTRGQIKKMKLRVEKVATLWEEE